MITHIIHYLSKLTLVLFAAAVAVTTISSGNVAFAAPPHTVSYVGTPVTTAVPGKPFTLKFQVKNTSTETYPRTQVTFHIPEGLSHSTVAPANAEVQDDTITWSDVPMAAGQTFSPSFTFTMDAGTALKTKLSLWVEVTGADVEATSKNFSVTAVSASKAKVTSTLSVADITALFQSVYGRTPTASESKYWLGRRTDKPGRTALQGAMAYHKQQNIKH